MSNTGAVSEIGVLITTLKNNNLEEAKKRCEAAQKEFKEIREKISVLEVKKVECVQDFINDVLNGRQKGVTKEVNAAWSIILKFYDEEKRKAEQKQSKAGTNKREARSEDIDQQSRPETDTREGENNDADQQTTTNTQQSRPETDKRYNEYDDTIDSEHEPITQRGVKAVATEFHNLYDNEWLHAYEELDDRIEEREKVQLLLEIVQKAYDYNRKERERQYKQVEDEAKYIVAGNKPVPDTPDGEKDLLVRYIYENAHVALPRLLRGFYEVVMADFVKKWKKHFTKIEFQLKDEMRKYVDKCVRVTWLICIEDPPIHMAYGKKDEPFDKIWDPFTRRGSAIDFIAWPALLNKNMYGEPLMKGKAQGK